MGHVHENVEHDIFSFFRASFMIAGHTKFCPDGLFALLVQSFHSYEVFNEEQFLCVYGQHANVSLGIHIWFHYFTQQGTS